MSRIAFITDFVGNITDKIIETQPRLAARRLVRETRVHFINALDGRAQIENLTQKEVGRVFGVTGSTISYWFKKANINWINFKRLFICGGAANLAYLIDLAVNGYKIRIIQEMMEKLDAPLSINQLKYIIQTELNMMAAVENDIPQGTRAMHRHHMRVLASTLNGGRAPRDGNPGEYVPADYNLSIAFVAKALHMSEPEAADIYGPNANGFLETRTPFYIINDWWENHSHERFDKDAQEIIANLTAQKRALEQQLAR